MRRSDVIVEAIADIEDLGGLEACGTDEVVEELDRWLLDTPTPRM